MKSSWTCTFYKNYVTNSCRTAEQIFFYSLNPDEHFDLLFNKIKLNLRITLKLSPTRIIKWIFLNMFQISCFSFLLIYCMRPKRHL